MHKMLVPFLLSKNTCPSARRTLNFPFFVCSTMSGSTENASFQAVAAHRSEHTNASACYHFLYAVAVHMVEAIYIKLAKRADLKIDAKKSKLHKRIKRKATHNDVQLPSFETSTANSSDAFSPTPAPNRSERERRIEMAERLFASTSAYSPKRIGW